MMGIIKIGDRVIDLWGRVGTVIGEVISWDQKQWNVRLDACYGDNYYLDDQLTLIGEQNKPISIIMDIKEKFLLAITAEPKRSFRKAGITNGDDLLTDDGMKVFLSWLLTKNQDDFKKEVVDPILEDMKDEKK